MGLKVCCTQGGILEGEPEGEWRRIGDVETYFAKAAHGDSSKAIVLLTDAFGLELVNNKLIADMLAHETGYDCFVPDLFNGTPLSYHLLGPIPGVKAYKEEQANKWFYEKAWDMVKLVGAFIPFLARHMPGRKTKMLEDFLTALPATSVGLSGYCYGGKAIDLMTKGTHQHKIKSIFVAHPSFLSPKEILQWSYPLSIAFPEEDMQMSKTGMDEIEAGLRRRDEPPSELVRYPDTQHGFAARPHWPDQKADFEKTLQQSIDWHRRFV